MPDMRKTPSYLKGLAETRARVAAEVQYYQNLMAQFGQELATAQAELDACDRLIRKYDERLNPSLIEPIKAWKGRYGPRGKLKEAVIRLIKERYPEAISTRELLIKLQVEFHLDFITPAERMDWKRNTLLSQLRGLVEEGLVLRLQDAFTVTKGKPGHWRWVGEGCESLGDLAELAKSSGVATSSEVEPYEVDEESDMDGLPV